ncbi:MAG: hypothetical protein FJ387_15260 [Verrucomicrobia bacterium]|nr:hypothetical protein [Verrucomicrobiota bacterium]
MRWNRRKFMLLGGALAATAGASGVWVGTSRSRSARWLRQMLADAQRRVTPPAVRPQPQTWPDNALTVCWLGHATVLINFYGVHILTDPSLSWRVGIDVGIGTLGPKRFVAPALSVRQLPRIDLVLLSHAHMDHMDFPTLRRLDPRATCLTARETGELLAKTPFRGAAELGWGDRVTLALPAGSIEVEAFEVKHWGRRLPNDRDRGYNGYVLRREGRALIFGGDTALTPRFDDLRARGPYALAIMPIASYNPWIRNHCTPEEAALMAHRAGAAFLVPMHHQTFKLSDEPMHEPIERLRAALEHEAERLALERVGEHFTVA